MSFTVDDARFVADMRMKMVQNMQKGLTPSMGIDKEELKRALEMIRKDRSIGAASSAKGKRSAPTIPIDISAFLTKTTS